MNEWINTGQPPLPEEYLEQVRAAIRDTLEKMEKGGIAGSIQNCVIVFENDPTFAGKISRNLLIETEDIKSFLSRSKDTYKFPYDRYAADHPRQCVFAGTINKTDFLPMDRTGNRRFLPIQVHPERAEVHILQDETASRAYIDQMWAEIMVIYDSGQYSIHLSREMEKQLAHEQERFKQEDTLAGQIYDFMEHYEGDKLCSKQIYKEALDHAFDEPKQWETREIYEIVNTGIANGEIQGWRAFTSSRRFEKYGTQRGWERIPAQKTIDAAPSVNQPAHQYEQMGFTVIENDGDCPF